MIIMMRLLAPIDFKEMFSLFDEKHLLSVRHLGAALFTEHLSSLEAVGLNFIIGRKLQTA